MTNYMKEVVNLLGVEDEEIFQIGNDTSLKNSFFSFQMDFCICPTTLKMALLGRLQLMVY